MVANHSGGCRSFSIFHLPLKSFFSYVVRRQRFFYVYNSNLIGEITERIVDMVYLEKLVMSHNGLCGGISSGLFMLKNLSILVGKIQEDFEKHQSEHG
ncbi:hypothetical protein MTR_5g045200 [Medicago truncatula]|uniref:Uncharacterized protein n=1 Tax=Medicago truncatula TaxID=3880 RepID=G7JY35_MEDTR|nr:hypothetical protein MTR_5g045200 [Medicago truncatula]